MTKLLLLLLLLLLLALAVATEPDAAPHEPPHVPVHEANGGLLVYNRIPKTGSASLRFALSAAGKSHDITVMDSRGYFLQVLLLHEKKKKGRIRKLKLFYLFI